MHIEHRQPIASTDAHFSLRAGIVRALLYFDIFQYPLTLNEIMLFCPVKIHSLPELEQELESMVAELLVFRFDGLYSIKNDLALAARRRAGNQQAADISPKAARRARLIQRFPFVRSVNISGSMSKNYFDEQTDLDFFIIAQPGRIWLCRLMLTVFKKIFLFNSRKYFCINYYIDAEHLHIPDENLFSATEVITLKNQTGEAIYRSFIQSNEWVKQYFPNYAPDFTYIPNTGDGFFKKIMERMFSGGLGNAADRMAHRITAAFLKRKYAALKKEEFEVNLRSEKHASKHHPQGFQFKVLDAFEKKCGEYESVHGIILGDA